MRLNAVLAAPGFEQWFDGEPLGSGQPAPHGRTAGRGSSIFSIAHLGDHGADVLRLAAAATQIVGWMRTQTGTSSLRAILYMDEIVGYFPPVANPPSKPPLLTLLKQARAFGLGVVLATQNPVDLDYKGLSNTGTWFLGRLQTERDKARVLDGLEGAAAAALDRAEADRMLSALGKRVFLLHNVHERAPVVFQTRWTLVVSARPAVARSDSRAGAAARRRGDGRAGRRRRTRPARRFQEGGGRGATPRRSCRRASSSSSFRPRAPGRSARAGLLPVRAWRARGSPLPIAKLGVDVSRDVIYEAEIGSGAVPVDWAGAAPVDAAGRRIFVGRRIRRVVRAAAFRPRCRRRTTASGKKPSRDGSRQTEKIELLRHRESKLTSTPGETERDFRIRLQEASRTARDEALDAVRSKYAAKQATLAERLRRAEAGVARESEQASQQKMQTAVSFGATIMGAFLGRKAVSAGTLGRATTAARGVGRTMKEASDVKRASETVEAVRAQIADARRSGSRRTTRTLAAAFDPAVELERVTLLPKRGQVLVHFVALGWDPR